MGRVDVGPRRLGLRHPVDLPGDVDLAPVGRVEVVDHVVETPGRVAANREPVALRHLRDRLLLARRERRPAGRREPDDVVQVEVPDARRRDLAARLDLDHARLEAGDEPLRGRAWVEDARIAGAADLLRVRARLRGPEEVRVLTAMDRDRIGRGTSRWSCPGRSLRRGSAPFGPSFFGGFAWATAAAKSGNNKRSHDQRNQAAGIPARALHTHSVTETREIANRFGAISSARARRCPIRSRHRGRRAAASAPGTTSCRSSRRSGRSPRETAAAEPFSPYGSVYQRRCPEPLVTSVVAEVELALGAVERRARVAEVERPERLDVGPRRAVGDSAVAGVGLPRRVERAAEQARPSCSTGSGCGRRTTGRSSRSRPRSRCAGRCRTPSSHTAPRCRTARSGCRAARARTARRTRGRRSAACRRCRRGAGSTTRCRPRTPARTSG